jgi:hypothetical protein
LHDALPSLADPQECGAAASDATLDYDVMRIIIGEVKGGPVAFQGRPV